MPTTRFTAKLGLKIIAERAAGATVAAAAAKHGVAESTLYLWLQYADQGIEPFVGFAPKFRAAKVTADRAWVAEQARLMATA